MNTPEISGGKAGKLSQLPLFELPPVELLWGSGELVIRNPRPEILQVLAYNHKSLEMNDETHKRDVITQKTNLYREVEPGVVTTFQGFLDLVLETCRERDIQVKFEDRRQKMPGARILEAENFRFGQRKLFLELIAKNRSGILKAPTRYGKTVLIANTCRVYPGVKTVVLAPGVSLLTQLQGDLKTWMPKREIRGIYSGSKGKKCSEDITVVSMDSIDKCDPENVKLVLVDEPHACVSPSRVVEMMKFRNARVYGFGATVSGRFDGADKIITGLIGPVLAEKTFKEAVTETAICPIVVYMVRMKYAPFPAFTRDQAYKKVIYRNESFNAMIQKISSQLLPADWQSMIFVDEIKQADLMKLMVEDGVVAVASRMDKDERKQKFDDMVANRTKRCICTDIYATGITFPDLRVIINAAGGGGSITSTQKPGRLAQMRPGKAAGYLIDFMFLHDREGVHYPKMNEWKALANDSYARLTNYKKIGFEVRLVSDLASIQPT